MNCFITSSLRPRPVVLAIALALSTGAYAQSAQQTTSTTERASSLHNYQIAAGQLGITLLEIARISRTAISVDPALVQGLSAPAIRGDLRVEQAVQRALADHALVLQRTENGTLTVVKRADSEARDTGALPEVKVTSTALADTGQHLNAPVNSGALGNRTVLETPFSSTVVTSADIAERQISKLGDVFATDASVSDNSGAYGAWATYLTVRGLALDFQNSFRIDGKPFLSYVVTLPYEHMEQIELLKGSTGFMYGFGSPGGLVNYVTKKPTDEPLRSVGVGYSSKGLLSEHVDIGGRVGENGRFGYRLNATHEEGRTFNNGSLNRNALSLALDARLTDKLTWDFQSIAQDRKAVGQEPTITTFGLVGNRLPSPIRNDNSTIVGSGVYADNSFRFYSTGLKYELTPDWKISANYSHSSTTTRRNESVLGLTDSLGNYTDTRSDYGESYQFNQLQAMLEGKFQTGSFEHQVVVGASALKLKNDYSRISVYQLIGTGNLASQNTNSYYSSGDLGLYRGGDMTQKALFASDTIKLSERVSVLAGLRYTNYSHATYKSDGTALSDPYKQNGIKTPTLALMYKLTPNTMAYTSYMESLEPGTVVGLTYANQRSVLDPLKSKQYEVGIKTEQSDWSATAAIFRIEKKSQYGNSANVFVQDGMAIYQGLELGAAARLAKNWNVGGSLMLLDSEYKNALVGTGNRVAGAPEAIVAAQLAYTVPQVPGLKLNANAKYTGATMLRASNDIQVAGYTLLNLGAVYDTRIGGYDTTFRLAINNATDKRYWMFQYENYVKAGDPRSLTLNATFKF
ncbi:TonB-dependent siderophore receptor [Herminiimonas arsenitoxidans]|uniref:TonB-dependent siderophore receptor n=1 Tax=Herminiimonas arsenitoxidans TaxID=1809410 RepID=UPI0009707C23|nr:TonB-dependent receptor [Herminiimonas arsenitoxidans]